MRAVVLGAGPAGLLATRALHSVGVRVTLVLGREHERRSQARHHVHVLPPATRSALQALLNADAGVLVDSSGTLHPDRTFIDDMLDAACRSHATMLVPGRARRIEWPAEGGVRVATEYAGEVHADLIVDATGTARASFAWAAAHAGRDVSLDAAPGSSRYTSMVIADAPEPTAGDLSIARDTESGWGVLLLGLGHGRVRVTLQSPSTRSPMDDETFLEAVVAYGPEQASQVVSEGTPEGRLHRWGPHPVARAALEDCEGMPEGWFPVGDAQLVTPPHMARGVRYAAEHARIMASGISARASFAEIRRTLGDHARASWMEATMTEALSTV